MKVLVCGGRDFNDVSLVFDTLARIHRKYGDDLEIITGACPTGADAISERWAKETEVDYRGFPAKWKKHGKSAGPRRNKRMRDQSKPDACVAFKGGDGTKGMIELMREIGIEPWLIGW